MSFVGGGVVRTDKGVVVTAVAPYAYSDTDKARFHGELYAVPASASVGFDLLITEEIRLYGGHYWVQGAHPGDKMSFQVVDVDDVLGGGAGAVVTEYISGMPIPPWDHERDLDSPTAALIQAGLYLRVLYESAGGTGTMLGVTYKWFVQSE